MTPCSVDFALYCPMLGVFYLFACFTYLWAFFFLGMMSLGMMKSNYGDTLHQIMFLRDYHNDLFPGTSVDLEL